MWWWIVGASAWAVCEDLVPAPTVVVDPPEVAIAGYRVATWVRDGADLVVEAQVRARVVDDATFGDVVAVMDAPPGGVLEDAEVTFTHLDPYGVSVSDDTFRFRFPAARFEAVKRWFLRGGPTWHLQGYEIPTLADHVVLIDADTDAAFSHEGTLVDGRSVWWFDALTPGLVDVAGGSVLLPTPDLVGWTGVNPPVTPQLPLDPAFCTRDFPALVDEVIAGDGLNGGDVGQVGVVLDPTEVPYDTLLRSVRIEGGFGGAPDGPGPFDTWVDPADEAARDGRACPSGDPIDVDGDGVPDTCPFTGRAARFELSPAAGLSIAGHLAWRGVDGDFRYLKRSGRLVEVGWSATAWMDTAINAHADAAVALPTVDLPLLDVDVPLASIPVGPTAISLAATMDVRLGADGLLEAGAAFGAVRHDLWTVDVGWTEGGGLYGDGTHDVVLSPLTTPRIVGAAGGRFDASLSAALGFSATEQFTQSSVSVGIEAEGWLALDVDAAATPWWTLDVGGDAALTAELALVGGLLGTFDDTWPMVGAAQTADEDDGAGPIGVEGLDGRFLASVDLLPGSTNTSSLADVADDGAGGVVAIGGDALNTYVMRLDGAGDPLWSRRLEFVTGAKSIAALPDGTIVAATGNCERVTLLDGAGAVLWDEVVDGEGVPQECGVFGVVDPAGVPGIALAHTRLIGNVYLPALTWLELDGAVRWTQTYASTASGRASGGLQLADGHVVLFGSTDVDAGPAAPGYATPNGGGLILELDGWGDPLWGTSINVARFEGVVEGPAGDLLAVADVNTYVYQPRHGMGLVSVGRDGALRWATTYAEDVRFEGRTDDALNRTPGDTAWDGADDLCRLDGGDLLLLGHSSLGVDQAAWMLRVTPDGEPVWFRMHDGAAEDSPSAVAAVGSGAVAVGWTKSFLGEVEPQRAWVARTPAEGGLRHDPTWGWSDRSMQVEINDLADHVHVLWVDPGGADVPLTVEPRTYVLDDTPPRTYLDNPIDVVLRGF